MLRLILGLSLLTAVGAGGYFLGTRRATPAPTPTALADASLLPLTELNPPRVETFDPVMFKMIENHFNQQADWKSGQ